MQDWRWELMLWGKGMEEEYDLMAFGQERKQAGVHHIRKTFIVVDQAGSWDED
jgi:hypothetical protein